MVAVESALRDLDDLAGNAARVVSAAEELAENIRVYVEIPYAPGWERAVEVVEAAGLFGKIRTGNPANSATPTYDQLAHQLSALVEADLAFKATAGLHHAQPMPGPDPDRPMQHGFLNLLAGVEALVEDASVTEAADVLRDADPARIGAWSEDTSARVRRRFRGFGCCGVLDPVQDLLALGLARATMSTQRREAKGPFTDELPYGVFSLPGQAPRVGVAIGERVLDLRAVLASGEVNPDDFAQPSLNAFMAHGPQAWASTRRELQRCCPIPRYWNHT